MNIENEKLKKIVSHYKSRKQKNLDTWILHCKNQKKLRDVIWFAGFCENHLRKRHPHQYRIRKNSLKDFVSNLISKDFEIGKAKSFDELLKLVTNCKVYGVGKLTIYDTATRIGAKLNLNPEYIYLHAGTKVGAEKLLGKRLRTNYIEKNELPSIFGSENLSNFEIEDLLCIYKDEFDTNSFLKEKIPCGIYLKSKC